MAEVTAARLGAGCAANSPSTSTAEEQASLWSSVPQQTVYTVYKHCRLPFPKNTHQQPCPRASRTGFRTGIGTLHRNNVPPTPLRGARDLATPTSPSQIVWDVVSPDAIKQLCTSNASGPCRSPIPEHIRPIHYLPSIPLNSGIWSSKPQESVLPVVYMHIPFAGLGISQSPLLDMIQDGPDCTSPVSISKPSLIYPLFPSTPTSLLFHHPHANPTVVPYRKSPFDL